MESEARWQITRYRWHLWSGGLGRHFALTLARAGAKVALAARRMEKLQEVADEIAGFDGRAPVGSQDRRRVFVLRECVGESE